MKPIMGYEGKYSVTEDGRVYSHRRVDACNRTKWGIYLKPKTVKGGYQVVGLTDSDNAKSMRSVHRLVGEAFLGLTPGQVIDHADGDRKNNDAKNLRVCNASQNQGNRKKSSNNTSGFKGVCWQKHLKKWQMSCRINGSRVYAWFETKEEAARKYDEVARRAHGSFARVNFPNG